MRKARAQAQARPSQALIRALGRAQDFCKPEPTQARPKPGLWAKPEPAHHYPQCSSGKLELHHYTPWIVNNSERITMVPLWYIILQNGVNRTNRHNEGCVKISLAQ